jgi:hypothetical protein
LKADVEAKDNKYMTSLHLACRACLVDDESLLIESAADVKPRGDLTETVDVAAGAGHSASVAALLAAAAEMSAAIGPSEIPLLLAAAAGHAAAVSALLAAPAAVDRAAGCTRPRRGRTSMGSRDNRSRPRRFATLPSSALCRHRGAYVDGVEALLAAHALANAAAADDGANPLALAADGGHAATAAALIRARRPDSPANIEYGS